MDLPKPRVNLAQVGKLLRLAKKMAQDPAISDALKRKTRRLAYAGVRAYIRWK